MTVLTLFAGIGGFDLAAEALGWEVVGVVEWDPALQSFLAERFPEAELWGDVREFTAEDFRGRTGLERPDVVIGSPPCQPFSSAGKRKGGLDERDMWPQFVRVVRELRPRGFCAENVAGMLSAAGPRGSYLGALLGEFAALGYVGTLGTCGADEAAGATFRGDRVWITGVLAEAASRGLGTVGPGPREGQPDRSGELAPALRDGWHRPDGQAWRGGRVRQGGLELAEAIDERCERGGVARHGGAGLPDCGLELASPGRGERGEVGAVPGVEGQTSPGSATDRHDQRGGPELGTAKGERGVRGVPVQGWQQAGQSPHFSWPGHGPFPPGPGDADGWLGVPWWLLPALDRGEQEAAERVVRGVADGVPAGLGAAPDESAAEAEGIG